MLVLSKWCVGLRPMVRFCFATQVNSIHLKILRAKEWQDFLALATKQSSALTHEALSATTKHLCSLISRDRNRTDWRVLKQLVEKLSGINESGMDLRNVTNTLSLLRNFSYRGLDMRQIKPLKDRLLNRYIQLLKSKPDGEKDMGELLYGFFQLVYFNCNAGTRMVVSQITAAIEANKYQKGIFTSSQLRFLQHLLATKRDLTVMDIKVRKYVLVCLSTQENVSDEDLMQAFVELSGIDSFDLDREQRQAARVIGKKVLQMLSDLDREGIDMLLKGPLVSKLGIFRQVFRVLKQHILAEVGQKDGLTTAELISLLDLLSDKVDIKQLNEKEKANFEKLIKNYIIEVLDSEDEKIIRTMLLKFSKLLQNGLYTNNVVNLMIDGVVKTNQPIRIGLLENFWKARADISPFIEQLIEESDNKGDSLLRRAVLLHRILEVKQYSQYHDQIKQALATDRPSIVEHFASPRRFTELIKTSNEEMNWMQIARYYKDALETMANPFEQESQQNGYEQAYLEFVIRSKTTDEIKQFGEKHALAIGQSISKLFWRDTRKYNTDWGLTLRGLIPLNYGRLPALIQAKDKAGIVGVIELCNIVCRWVIGQQSYQRYRKFVMEILHKLLKSFKLLVELECSRLLQIVILKYLSIKDSHAEFQEIINHGLRIIGQFTNHGLTNILVSQGLKLNIIDEKMAKGVKEANLPYLGFVERSQIEYLCDPTYRPDITKINNMTVPLVLNNHNLADFVETRIEEFKACIIKMRSEDLQYALALFNLPIRKGFIELLNLLIEQFLANFVPIDKTRLAPIFNNLSNHNYRASNYRKLADTFIEKAKKPYIFDVPTHCAAIKFIITNPSFDGKEYFKSLSTYAHSQLNDMEVDEVLSALRTTSYEFDERDLGRLGQLLKKNVGIGLQIFLTNEEKLGDPQKEKLLAQLAEFNSRKNNKRIMTELAFNYLTRNYPSVPLPRPEQFFNFGLFQKPWGNPLQLMEQLGKHHGVQPQLTVCGITLFRIKDVAFFFLNPKKIGSIQEQNWAKKALEQELNCKVIVLGPNSRQGLVSYISKVTPEIIDEALAARLKEGKIAQAEE